MYDEPKVILRTWFWVDEKSYDLMFLKVQKKKDNIRQLKIIKEQIEFHLCSDHWLLV